MVGTILVRKGEPEVKIKVTEIDDKGYLLCIRISGPGEGNPIRVSKIYERAYELEGESK